MRMIDADRMLSELKPITYDMEQNVVTIADMSNIMRNWVMRQPTIPAPQWISVKDRLPEESKEVLIYLPEYNSVETASLFTIPSLNLKEWTQDEDSYMLDEVSYWMPLPEPPDKRYKCRYADDNGVCSKCSGNGEIIYCVEGPCPYDMPEEVQKACINCAYASESYPSFMNYCDLDGHVIADAHEYSCKNFYPLPEEDDDGKSKLD